MTVPFAPLILPVLSLVCLLAGQLSADDTSDPQGIAFFEKKIRPILVKHCYECHSSEADDVSAGLYVDSRQGLLTGGDMGAAVVPGEISDSLLIQAIEYRELEMPPEGRLPEEVIRDFRRWVRMGAPDPRNGQMPAHVAADDSDESRAEDLWSVQPIVPHDPPTTNSDWPRSSIDHFVHARHAEHGLDPVADAEPLVLLRRLCFDLTGLPPTLQQMQAIQADSSPEAFSNLIDELLASPAYGERWARHWMDVVRYAESAGSSRDVLMPHAWRYRDYVIDAFNDDMPYDRFIAEQVAGDLLPADSPEEADRLQVATGLLAIGSKSLNGGNLQLDLVDDQIDVIGKAMLGLTVSCARCHDHKFDPIPTADYYALAGIFKSTETFYGGGTRRPKDTAAKLGVYLPLGTDAEETAETLRTLNRQIAKLTKERQALGKSIARLKKALPDDWKQRRQALAQQTAEPVATEPQAAATTDDAPADDAADDATESESSPITKKDEKFLDRVTEFETAQTRLREVHKQLKELDARQKALPELEFALGVREAKKIVDSPIHIRGERRKTGEVVPRGFLSCIGDFESLTSPVTGEPVAPIDSQQSGRLQLAAWLAHPDNPLPPRVIVNRVWQHLFGRGLVESVDNFGINGSTPSHPELLDSLSWRFVHVHNWSIKSLIREIVQSRTYQLSSDYHEQNVATDPANTFLWKMSRKRLEAEPFRDAMLAAGGTLRLDRPEASPVAEIGEGEVGRGINTKPLYAPYPYRSVYLPIIRGLVPESLKVFDFPEPSNPQGARDTTNVPAQSLYLMNSPFVLEQAGQFARRVVESSEDDLKRLQNAFAIAFTREPEEPEVATMLGFLSRTHAELATEYPDEAKRTIAAWTAACHTLFASAEFRYVD
ncbi:Planctomycete cytochrome C [Maioricimonas rarisocia]|uniref:Planctomycete cytochrome C n=1 Tax=Maioricimonas rarisocia TaxID=2528026 RepID=A0A517ZCW2_9PLAN|nr:PSD1 and planctomycete cytochrome C domain-containing protein [Maioricimonas rarisocia]QDU40280.1 Planctomycete cytochrome C [Maioricimonas rarisocia]